MVSRRSKLSIAREPRSQLSSPILNPENAMVATIAMIASATMTSTSVKPELIRQSRFDCMLEVIVCVRHSRSSNRFGLYAALAGSPLPQNLNIDLHDRFARTVIEPAGNPWRNRHFPASVQSVDSSFHIRFRRQAALQQY